MRARLVTFCVLLALLAAVLPAAAFGDSGERTYGYAAHWPSPFAEPWRVAGDKAGRVYFSSAAENRILVYGTDGTYVRSIGSTGSGDGQFNQPTAIACDRWNRLYVADSGGGSAAAARIQVFDEDGAFLYKATGISDPRGDDGSWLYHLTVADDGDVYTSISMQSIERRDARLQLVRSWTASSTVLGLAIDERGDLYTGSRESRPGVEGHHRIDIYTGEGDHRGYFGVFGSAPGQLSRPVEIEFDPFGHLLVADMDNQRLQVFGASHGVLSVLNGPAGKAFGQVGAVHAGKRRDAYVMDMTDWGAPYTVHRLETTASTIATQVAGVHRYNTAVKASRKAFPDGAGTVVVATGLNFPDALGAAALAGAKKGPVLLAAEDSCPG